MKEKSQLSEKVVPLIKDLKAKHGKQVKFIRCDNAGENKILEATCKKESLGIIFEFTAPGTPQQNGMVERAFATLYGSMRAMMKTAGLTQVQKNELWAECANTATDLNNIVLNNRNTPYQAFFGNDPKFINNLHIFGEKAVVKKAAKIQSKLKDKGIQVMFLGYAKDHAEDVFRFLNLETNRVILSRDVIWLNKFVNPEKTNTDEPREVLMSEIPT